MMDQMGNKNARNQVYHDLRKLVMICPDLSFGNLVMG